MENKTVYVFMVQVDHHVYDQETKKYVETKTNELVHCSGQDLPYLTESPDGLSFLLPQYNIFRYMPEEKIAKYIPHVRHTGNLIGDVRLRDDQIAMIEKAIKAKNFYNFR